MQNDLDWQSLMSSEVFRNYLQIELRKEAEVQELQKEQDNQVEKLMEAFHQLETLIKENVLLKHQFKQVQAAIRSNQINVQHLSDLEKEAFLMLELDDEEI